MPTHPKRPLTARTADPRALYEQAVQCPEAEIDFITTQFKRLSGRPARRLREDFCGTAIAACEFVARHKANCAVGLDLDTPTLDWAARHNLARLTTDQRERITLLTRDVLHPKGADRGFDAIAAMNFSYWVFDTRDLMRTYFSAVRNSLARDGVFFMDIWGGYESMKEQTERRRCRGFTYVWDQHSYDPLSGRLTCHIHFDFKKGPMLRRAFTYHWRLWTVPEIKELLAEAGFSRTTIYWEGEDARGRGTGVFRPRRSGLADASFICYITAQR